MLYHNINSFNFEIFFLIFQYFRIIFYVYVIDYFLVSQNLIRKFKKIFFFILKFLI